MRWPMLVLSLWATSATFGQQFELVDPQDRVTATVEFTRSRLIVTESTGETVVFAREERYDSPDREFLGFVNLEIDRVLRFPQSGRGKLQVADLRDRSPRFRFSQRAVRPIGRRPAGAPPTPPRVDADVNVPSFGSAGPYPAGPHGVPIAPAYGYGYGYPQSVLLDSQLIPNPSLPPVTVELINGDRRQVQVRVVDLKSGGSSSFRLQPGESRAMEFRREAGGTRVDRYQTVDAFGQVVTRKVVRPLRPTIRYEVVVHQWVMQSVAIDRTGKSPDPIEDVKFQGKGLGRFRLPAGDRLTSGRIDVAEAARNSGTSFTVAPIPAQEDRADVGSPLERAVLEAQLRAQNR